MEQRHRIRLTTSNTFDLERAEIKRLYTYLGLFQYRYMRTPDYRERPLIEQLAKDFKSFHKEMLAQVERDPNNLVLSRINGFFSNHYRWVLNSNFFTPKFRTRTHNILN